MASAALWGLCACARGAPGSHASAPAPGPAGAPATATPQPAATAPTNTGSSATAANPNAASPTGTPKGAISLALTLSAPTFDPDAPGLAALAALEISVVEASLLLADGSGQPQLATPLSAGACTTPPDGTAALRCALTLTGVDPTMFPQGLAIRARDLRPSPGGPAWATVHSFLGADALAAANANAPLAAAATLLSSAGLDLVAAWAQVAGADLTARGAVLGTLHASAASATPLAGATIKPSQSGLSVGYAGVDGQPAPAPTSALGMFVATPPAARTVMTATWRIALPDGGGTSETPGPAFGATGGVVSALTFVGP